jgi:hypothetical protein
MLKSGADLPGSPDTVFFDPVEVSGDTVVELITAPFEAEAKASFFVPGVFFARAPGHEYAGNQSNECEVLHGKMPSRSTAPLTLARDGRLGDVELSGIGD